MKEHFTAQDMPPGFPEGTQGHAYIHGSAHHVVVRSYYTIPTGLGVTVHLWRVDVNLRWWNLYGYARMFYRGDYSWDLTHNLFSKTIKHTLA